MKTWKLVSGILSILLFAVVVFQSCAAGIVNTLSANGEVSGSAGVILAVLMLAGGIVSVATRKSYGNGGNIAIIILYSLGALTGLTMGGSFADLMIWSIWCLICAVVATIPLTEGKRWIMIVVCVIAVGLVAINILGKSGTTVGEKETEENEISEQQDVGEGGEEQEEKENAVNDESKKYKVGETWENESIRVTYKKSGVYKKYEDYEAPKKGNKIIYLKFEIENIGSEDISVSYMNFHGYADNMEIEQNYAPEGSGISFALSLSPKRKGKGVVAFEVPKKTKEVEVEFEPDFFGGEKVLFTYE